LTQSIKVENLNFCAKGRLRLPAESGTPGHPLGRGALYAGLKEKPAWAKFSGGGENFAYFVLLGQNITIIT
jgi:hypothetical protein